PPSGGASAADSSGASESDSTQRLLAALGNLEAQVEAAKKGASKDTWSEQCMGQLINAVELALEEDWVDVVDVLTETARILETYKRAGRQQECVPFLADSYEIMSGMVVDLMLGEDVRPNVLKRWDKRYQQALREVAGAGLTLVKDDDTDESTAPDSGNGLDRSSEGTASTKKKAVNGADEQPSRGKETPKAKKSQASAPANGGAKKTEPGQSPFDMDIFQDDNGDSGSTPAGDGSSSLAELPGFNEDPSSRGASGEKNANSAPANGEAAESPFDPVSWTEDDTEEETGVEPPAFPLGEAGEEDTGSGKGAKAREEAHEVSAADDDMEFMLDSWSEALAQLEHGPQDKQEEYLGDAEESVNLLEGLASQNGRWQAVEACHTCQELLALVSPSERPSGRLIELAYAFCGAYAEAEDPDASTLTDWKAECQRFLEEARNPTPAAAAEPAEPVTLDHVRIERESPSSHSRSADEEVKSAMKTKTELESGPPVEPEPEPEPEAAPDSGGQAEPDPLAEAESLAEAVERGAASSGAAPPESLRAGNTATKVQQLPPVHIEAAVRTAMAMRDSGSPEQLLGVAMQAIARGEGESAKLLALRAAAMLAQTEAQKAEAQLGEAENKLEQGVRAIEHARQEVTEAEQAVSSVESSVSESENALEECSQESARIVEHVTGLEERISDLDAQIKALQEQREQEAQALAQSQAQLEQAREQEREQQQRIEELKASKKTAREQLEDARQRVKDLQQRRTEVENTMERAREALERRRSSMKDIEETIAQVANKDDGPSVDMGDLLF
ncbi:MAG: hypothetical protein ACLFV4_06805, partial [Candidatus Hydrogenedentota bacterium]